MCIQWFFTRVSGLLVDGALCEFAVFSKGQLDVCDGDFDVKPTEIFDTEIFEVVVVLSRSSLTHRVVEQVVEVPALHKRRIVVPESSRTPAHGLDMSNQ